jgi:hypothetical protein
MLPYRVQGFAPVFRSTTSSARFIQARKYSKVLPSAIPQQVTGNIVQNGILYEGPRASDHRSLALSPDEDDPVTRQKYRPFILPDDAAKDWVSALELTAALDMAEENLRLNNERLRVLVLYGSLRRRSYSRLVAFEASRILHRLGCDVRIFNPEGLPVKNDSDIGHVKVQELRELSKWSDGHVWISPEQHGNLVSYYPHHPSTHAYLLRPH